MAKDFTKVGDYELVKLSAQGDETCFAELISRYKNLVYSIVLRMITDREEANDLAQDVFVKIYKNLDKYYPEYKFSTWVMKITTNHVIDYRRKKRQDTVSLSEADYDIPSTAPSENPEDAYLSKERQAALSKAIAELPDMYKAPIVLYHRQGLSYQEISEIIDEPLSKVKNRIFRGRKMLKETLLGAKGGVFYGV